MPVSIGRFFSNSVIASKPPAEAPIATIGKDAFLLVSTPEFLFTVDLLLIDFFFLIVFNGNFPALDFAAGFFLTAVFLEDLLDEVFTNSDLNYLANKN